MWDALSFTELSSHIQGTHTAQDEGTRSTFTVYRPIQYRPIQYRPIQYRPIQYSGPLIDALMEDDAHTHFFHPPCSIGICTDCSSSPLQRRLPQCSSGQHRTPSPSRCILLLPVHPSDQKGSLFCSPHLLWRERGRVLVLCCDGVVPGH